MEDNHSFSSATQRLYNEHEESNSDGKAGGYA